MKTIRAISISILGSFGLALSACGGDSGANLYKDLQVELKSWNLTKKATEAYPDLPEDKAKKNYANKMMFDYFRSEPDAGKRQLMASLVYLGYAQLNTRARPHYCAKVNVDISDFKQKFERQHKAEDKAVNLVLARHNLTPDMIWEENERYMMVSVKNDLLRAGGLQGSHAMCSDIRKKPQHYAKPFNFSKIMPHAAAQLRQAQAQEVTRQAQLDSVPSLRK